MAVLTAVVDYLPYGLKGLYARKPATAIAATGSATNTLSATAHGKVNGEAVSLSSIVTLTNVAVATQYFVIAAAANTLQIALTPGGAAIVIGNSGSANILSFLDVELRFPNAVSAEPSTTDYEWAYKDTTETLSTLTGIVRNLDSRSIPQYAHSVLFSKDEITVSGGDNAIGYGGGDDREGITVGIVFKQNAKKKVNGAQIGTVTYVTEHPTGVLTVRAPNTATTGEVPGLFGYSYSASPGNYDVNGALIAGMDDEDFLISYEEV